MKITAYPLLVLTLVLGVTISSSGQSQWKFPIAFEDTLGAKDTIWMIWDTAATAGDGIIHKVDTALGEARVPMDLTRFNVFVINEIGDSTKTVAFPYSLYPHQEAVVFAVNFTYPVIIRWDTSLFHSPVLPLQLGMITYAGILNDYFYWYNNMSLAWHYYNMFKDDTAYAPAPTWWGASQFPMDFYITGTTIPVGITDQIKPWEETVIINPVRNNELNINLRHEISQIRLFSETGALVFSAAVNQGQGTEYLHFDLPPLKPGIYILELSGQDHKIFRKKIIKL